MGNIELQDPRHDKAVLVSNAWFRLKNEQEQVMAQWTETRKYLTALTTRDTEVGTLDWKNKTRIPKLTQIRDNLIAQYMAAIFPNDEFIRWEGIDAESHAKANVIEQYMLTKIRMSDYRSAIEKTIADWVDYGNAFTGVEWVVEKTKSAVTGEEIINYIGPKTFRISPMDCVMDPRAKDFDSSPFIWRKMMTLGDFLAQYEESAPDVAAKVKEMRNPTSDITDFYKEEGFQIDGFQSFGEYLASGYVDILEYWGDIFVVSTGEYLRNRKIVIADKSWVVEDTENPTWNGKKPFTHTAWRKLSDNLYGQSPLANLIGMQYRVDHIENAKADIYDQTIHPVVVVKGDLGEDYVWEPGAVWTVPIDGDVQVRSPDASVLQADAEMGWYMNMMEQMAGSPRESMGFRTPGEKTAFEVSVLQQGADRQFLDKTNAFEETTIQPNLNLQFELLVRNLDVPDLARTFNDDTRALELTQLTKEDVVADGILRPVGSKHFAKRAQRIQEINNMFAMAENPLSAPHMSGFRFAKAVEEELGFEKYGIVERDIAVKEQAMTQASAATIQQQLQQVIPQAAQQAPDEAE